MSSVRSRWYFMPLTASTLCGWDRRASGLIVQMQSAFGFVVLGPASGSRIGGIHGLAGASERAAADAGITLLGQGMFGHFPDAEIELNVLGGPVRERADLQL